MRYSAWILLLCTVGMLRAGDGPPPKPGTLRSVAVKGNHLYTAEDIIKVSGLKTGQTVSPEIIEAARQKLVATELFNNVSDRYQFTRTLPITYDLTFEVQEFDQLYPVRFERLGGASPEEVRNYLRQHLPLYCDKVPGTEGVLRRYAAAIQEFVNQKDPSLKVKGTISNDDPKQLTALFTSSAPAPVIAQVTVEGNQAVDTGTILRAVNATAVGTPLSDARLQSMLEGTIKPLYAAKGYAAVNFPKIQTEPAKTNLGVIVHVTIREGPQFKFGPIHFRGKGMDEEEIRSNIPFRPGQVFNGKQVDDFRLELIRRMRRRGLLDADVVADYTPDDAKHTVDVTYNVMPGSVYTFQKLDIRGLDANSEPVIAKLWGEKPGKPFNPEYPDFFLKRVEEENLFDNLGSTSSDYTADASTHSVTVHLYFRGGESLKEKERKKQEDKEKQKTDGTWNPWPY